MKLPRFWNRLTKPTSIRKTGGIFWRLRGAFDRGATEDDWWTLLPYRNTGVVVTHENAMQLSACIACIRARAEDIGKMPWRVYRRTGQTRERQDDSQLDKLLNVRPNPEMGSMDFRCTLLMHAQGWGNGYAEIERSVAGRPIALWPLEPWRVEPRRDQDESLYYEVKNELGPPTYLDPRDIFHIKGLSEDGVTGLDTIANAALTLGFGISAEEFGSNFYTNNTTVGTSFKTPHKLTEPAYENLKKEIRERRGSGRAFEGMVLQQGLEPVNVTMNQTDAQYIETRRFQIEEICRHFRIPLHKVFDIKDAHFNNVEQFNINYVNDSLMPWVKRLEEEADYKLIPIREPRYTRIILNSLLRGDMKTRMEFYQGMHRMGAVSQNEIRGWEDLDPIEDGDQYFMQAQMRTVKSIIEQSEQPQQVVQPMVENMLRRFWDKDRKDADDKKQKLNSSQFYSWVSDHHGKIKKSREKAINDNLETLNQAYGKSFSIEWLLDQYTTWSVNSLISLYRNQNNRIDLKAFTAYFLEALNNADTSQE